MYKDKIIYTKGYGFRDLEQKLPATESTLQIDSLNASRVQNTNPSHAIAAYGDIFSHPVYGDVQIDIQGDRLSIKYRGLSAMLDHWHYDQFITVDEGKGYPDMKINFLANDKGDIDRISTRPFGDPVTEFVKVKP